MIITPGASEVAVILGVQRRREDGDPYCSEMELWARLSGLIPRYDSAGGPDAECGRWFEGAVLGRYGSERSLTWGTDYLPGPALDQEPARVEGIPWHCRWDAYNGAVNRPVEAKCPRVLDPERWGSAGSDQVPVDHAVQVACQLAVAHRLWGATTGDLAAFARAPGWGDDRVWAVYHLERDADLERRMVERVSAWLDRHVVEGHPPEPDGSASASDALRRIWAPVDDQVLVAGDAELELYRRLLQVRSARDELEHRLQEVRQELQLRIGEATELRHDEVRLVTWRLDRSGRRRFRVLRRDQLIEEDAA